MSLQNFQYDIIMREYNRRQTQVMHDLEKRRSCAFAKAPRLAEIDREVASLSAQKARSLLCGQSSSVEDLKKSVARLARNVVLFSGKTAFLKIIWSPITSVPAARIPATQTQANAPASKKQRSNFFILSPILQKFWKKKILSTFLLTGILIQ